MQVVYTEAVKGSSYVKGMLIPRKTAPRCNVTFKSKHSRREGGRLSTFSSAISEEYEREMERANDEEGSECSGSNDFSFLCLPSKFQMLHLNNITLITEKRVTEPTEVATKVSATSSRTIDAISD